MRAHLFLRVILALAFAGLFVAGALSVTKLFGLGLPCGATGGCDAVNNHPSAYWFKIPVAYFGFAGYLGIAILAFVRSAMAAGSARKLALFGYLLSGFGALTSVALQLYSFTVIHATCWWCFGSAVIMVLLLVFHALEYGERVSDDVPAGKGEFLISSVLAVAVALLLVGFTSQLKKSHYIPPMVVSEDLLAKTPLVPKEAHVYGDPKSPVTIVEFADLMCPMCQQSSPKIKEFVNAHPGKVRMVYRHFPLEMHRMGMLSAAVAEAAAEDGKFWDFVEAIMATGENMETADRVFEIARGVGLDESKIRKRLDDENSPANKRLTQDINAGHGLGMKSTPTFIVQVKGMETQAYGFRELMDALQNGPYKKVIEGK